jgi:hypothetical protein
MHKMQLITGCNANAHHIIWGRTDINPQREHVMKYLIGTKLNILNGGNEPTFAISNRKKVIDLTLGTEKIEDLASNWYVPGKISLSGHRTK